MRRNALSPVLIVATVATLLLCSLALPATAQSPWGSGGGSPLDQLVQHLKKKHEEKKKSKTPAPTPAPTPVPKPVPAVPGPDLVLENIQTTFKGNLPSNPGQVLVTLHYSARNAGNRPYLGGGVGHVTVRNGGWVDTHDFGTGSAALPPGKSHHWTRLILVPQDLVVGLRFHVHLDAEDANPSNNTATFTASAIDVKPVLSSKKIGSKILKP
jgi:hypothetical protein